MGVCLFAEAQRKEYAVQQLRHTSLMNPSQAKEILRDDKGFLWMLFPSCVQRFDGRNVKTFSFDDRCISLQQDAQGRIWVAARQRLYLFANDWEGFKEWPGSARPTNWYRKLAVTENGRLYLLTSDGLLNWNEQTKGFEPTGVRPFKNDNSFPVLESFGVCLFYEHDNYLYRFNTQTARQDSLPFDAPNFLFPINADSVWVRSGIGNSYLVSFPEKNVRAVTAFRFDEESTKPTSFVIGSYKIAPGRVLVFLQNRGVYIHDAATQTFTPVSLFLDGQSLRGLPAVNGFLVEKDGTIWIPFESTLISFNPHCSGLNLLRSGGAWNNDIRSFAEDKNGNIWFGTANGFCRWNRKTGLVKTWEPKQDKEDYLNFASVRGLAFNGQELIVQQSEKGVWLYHPSTERFSRPVYKDTATKQSLLTDFGSNLLLLRNGQVLLQGKKLYLLEKGTNRVSTIPVREAGRSRMGLQDAQGRIWLAGVNGLIVLDSTYRVLSHLSDNVINRWANALVQIDSNTFWLAAKGLYEVHLAGKTLSIKSIFPELKTEHISGLHKDQSGNVWMANIHGLYRWCAAEKLLEKWDATDNASDFYVGFANHFRSSDSTLYWASVNGISYFVPEHIEIRRQPLQLYLLNVSVNGDDSGFLKQGFLPELKHFQNAVSFTFVAPLPFGANRVRYRYRLSGAGEWTDIGNNASVQFSALQAGSYTFEAAASYNGRDWYHLQQPFHFIIHPPFWKRWWFWTALLMAAVIFSAVAVRRRIRSIREQEARKIQWEKSKTENYRYQLEIEQIVHYFTRSLSEQKTVDDVLWDVARNCIAQLGFDDCVIYMLEEEEGVLVQKAAWGPKTGVGNDIISPIVIPLGKGIVGSVAASGVAEKIADTSADPRYIVDDCRRYSEIAVPIFEQGKVIGVIDSEHGQKNFYTQQHLQILSTIASHCGARIAKIKAEARSEEARLEALLNKQQAMEASLQSLRLQMNPHFLFNVLNSIQQMILSGDEENATRFLSRFSKLLRRVLVLSDQEEVSLKQEIEVLALYIELEALRFNHSFSYSITCHEAIDVEETRVPSLLYQTLAENAIWHGLLHKEGERKLNIHFEEREENLLCLIDDNGIGRAAAAHKDRREEHTGRGLSLVRNRLQVRNEKNGTQSFLHIIDKKDAQGNALGTRVEVLLQTG